MSDTLIEAPKMFREMDGIVLENVRIPFAQQTLWHCRNVALKHVEVGYHGLRLGDPGRTSAGTRGGWSTAASRERSLSAMRPI